MNNASALRRTPSVGTGRTLVESAYDALRQEILDGTFEPGAKLRTEELRTRYNVSGSTIREALTRLLGEALVTAEGQRGFRVAPASLEDFQDLTEVRKLIEIEALRRSIAAGDETWESTIVAAFYRLSKAEERLADEPLEAFAEFEERNRKFHDALIAACTSRWLLHINGLLFQQSERYRRMTASRRTKPRDVHSEHQAIFEATLARNAQLACTLMADHIDRTLIEYRLLQPKAKRLRKTHR